MSTPPRIERIRECPPAPKRPPLVIPPSTTSILIMRIQIRKNGDPDDHVEDEDDQEQWMTTNLYFTSRDAMAHYFTYLFQSGNGNGYENAILAHIEENTSLDKFLQKIASMDSRDSWQINKNLNIYVYTNVLNT
jgi:hypothetical protein